VGGKGRGEKEIYGLQQHADTFQKKGRGRGYCRFQDGGKGKTMGEERGGR